MKKYISILLLLLIIPSAYSQILNIPDVNFKTALINHSPVIDTNSDGEIQVSEANAFSGFLNIFYKSISDITGIEAFTSITKLRCSGNNFTSLDLSFNTNLITLYCSNVPLTSLDITQCSVLEELKCSYTNLSTLNVSLNPYLKNIECNSVSITSIDLSQNLMLEVFESSYHNFSTLDFSYNSLLTGLDCWNGNLTTLILPASANLTYVYCPDNSITNLNVSQNPNLTILDISGNNITSLDLSQNPNLTDLYISSNNITSLDLSQNPNILSLYADNNNLSTVDIRNGANIILVDSNVYFYNNPNLFCISVDDPIYSSTNWINNIDFQTNFSSNCDSCQYSMEILHVENITCADSGSITATISGATSSLTYDWQPSVNATVVNDTQLFVTTNGIYQLSTSDNLGCTITKGVLVNGTSHNNDFDLVVNGFESGIFFPGFANNNFDISASNIACLPVSGEILLVYSGLIEFISADKTPDQISGDTLLWEFDDWTLDTPIFFNQLTFLVDSFATDSDEVCFHLYIMPTDGDLDSLNNEKEYCYEVVNSYDPNNKQVHPQGKCNNNYILPEEKLTYTVHFQNTGNAPAININILDSLSSSLNINSLKVIATSHEPMITEIIDSDVLSFRFDNIFLPDSTSNPVESQGFITYEVEQKPNLPVATIINNQADIYFDFNVPIITNTVFNTVIDEIPAYETVIFDTINENETYTLPNGQVVSETNTYITNLKSDENCDSIVITNLFIKTASSIRTNLETDFQAIIFPNPTTNSFTVKISEGEKMTIEVFNTLGQEIYNEPVESKKIIINTATWNNGIYNVIIKDKSGIVKNIQKVSIYK